jgi:hypothetical protein
VVTPAPLFAAAPEPDDWAVPALLVPGAVGSLAALPAPLGSLTELFGPPGLAGCSGHWKLLYNLTAAKRTCS